MTEFDFRAPEVLALERAFGISLDERESARCTSAAATVDLLASRLRATDDVRPPLRPAALGVVREALRDIARADRERVHETSSIAALLTLEGSKEAWRKWLEADLRLLAWPPPRTAGEAVDVLVASDPARLRAGTEWTRAQIAEVVEVVFRRHESK